VSCWDSQQENTSINDNSNNPNQQWENKTMKHSYYSIVVSLRCDKTFNRVSQVTITYYECLSAALVNTAHKHMYHVILPSVVRLHIFPHRHIKQHNFQKNVIEHKMFISIFPKTPVSNISYRKNAGRYHNKCTKVLT